MENISPEDLALELLNQCLRGNDYSPDLLRALVRMALSADEDTARTASHALFGTVVEPLADLFEPCLVDCYASLFSEVIEMALPGLRRRDLVARFRVIRQPRKFAGDADRVRRVVVLSRVTLGADAAITSQFLDAAKRAFPKAQTVFAGPGKNYELFAADSLVEHFEIPYPRAGTLAGRLSVFEKMRTAFSDEATVVLDTDSRLTQLGLLPVCAGKNCYLFESRGAGEYGAESLGTLAQAWLRKTFSVETQSYVAPPQGELRADITVSLGVGENPAKRIRGDFEAEWMRLLAATGKTVLVDRGGSAEEASRVDKAIAGLPNVSTWTGAFAPFAAAIANSSLYCGYDSAGQHVAAAAGVPLIAVFAGYPHERFRARWTPFGKSAIKVISAEGKSSRDVLRRITAALKVVW